jgi:hypothetical protein
MIFAYCRHQKLEPFNKQLMRGLLNNLMYEIAGIGAMIIVYIIIYCRSIKSSFRNNDDNKNRYFNS